MKNFSFKQYVEKKDLNEVGQYVFNKNPEGNNPEGNRGHTPEIRTSLNQNDDEKPQFGYRDTNLNFDIYDKANTHLGHKTLGNFSNTKGKNIFKISFKGNDTEVSFTEEMKQHLLNNNKEVFYKTLLRNTPPKHDENKMIASIGRSMLAIAGSVILNRLHNAYRNRKSPCFVDFEPVFEFISQNLDKDISVFKRLLPLLETGLKTVVREVRNEQRREIELYKKDFGEDGTGYTNKSYPNQFPAGTRVSKYEFWKSIFPHVYDGTKIEIDGHKVVFSPAV